MCQGPEAGECFVCEDSEQKISVAGAEEWRGTIGEKTREVAGAKSSQMKPFTKT